MGGHARSGLGHITQGRHHEPNGKRIAQEQAVFGMYLKALPQQIGSQLIDVKIASAENGHLAQRPLILPQNGFHHATGPFIVSFGRYFFARFRFRRFGFGLGFGFFAVVKTNAHRRHLILLGSLVFFYFRIGGGIGLDILLIFFRLSVYALQTLFNRFPQELMFRFFRLKKIQQKLIKAVVERNNAGRGPPIGTQGFVLNRRRICARQVAGFSTLAQGQHLVRIGRPETIDRLLGVAHHHIPTAVGYIFFDERLQIFPLACGGILKFVHQNMMIFGPGSFVEIRHVGLLQEFVNFAVKFRNRHAIVGELNFIFQLTGAFGEGQGIKMFFQVGFVQNNRHL